ncbi:MAG: cupin domain-containing protein [Egibacteraceae bacterium]
MVMVAAMAPPQVGASPGSGASGVILAQGVMPEGLEITVAGPNDLVFQQVAIEGGGHTGWHSHPGTLLVVVKAGTLTRYKADCTFETYTEGESFIETEEMHIGRNEDPFVPAELYVLYLNPVDAPLRSEAEHPDCGL